MTALKKKVPATGAKKKTSLSTKRPAKKKVGVRKKAPLSVKPGGKGTLAEIFQASSYKIQQPYIQITKEGYNIQSSDGSELYYAERSRRLFRSILANMATYLVTIVVFMGTVTLLAKTLPKSGSPKDLDSVQQILFLIKLGSCLGLSFLAGVGVKKLIAPLRVTNVYMGKEKDGEPLFQAMPSSVFFLFTKTFSLLDENENEVVKIVRPFFPSLYRTQWKVFNENDEFIFKAQEDNIILGFLRRYLKLGNWIPLHFQFNKGNGNEFASFKRRISLRDKYELEFDKKAVEPWLMIAVCILLDTGENR
jgi:uncharacterized protein YxjI